MVPVILIFDSEVVDAPSIVINRANNILFHDFEFYIEMVDAQEFHKITSLFLKIGRYFTENDLFLPL